MKAELIKKEGNVVNFKLTIDNDKFEAAINKAYNKNKGKFNIPGFRKGKAPRKIIETNYGKGVFYNDAIDIVFPEVYPSALDELQLAPIDRPSIDVEEISKDNGLVLVVQVEVQPEFELGQYKGIEVAKVDYNVTDEEVDKEIDKERESNARNIDVTDRAVKDGDIVTLDFEGFVDGTAFEGGKGENYPLTIGSGTFIPGFEEQLVGAEIGKETEVNVTFPEDYQAEDLKGKAAVFKCTVKEIKEKELPALDDEFASEVSEFETLAEYKADIRGRLEERKAKAAREAKEAAVIEEIIKDSDMEIPEAMIETQQRQMIDEFAQRIQMQGLTLEQYFQFTGASYDQMIEQVKPQAEKRIQSRLVLEAVAAAEKIEATEEDYEEELKSMAEAYQMEVDKVKELLPEKSVQQIKEDIAVKKAAEFVVDNAKEK